MNKSKIQYIAIKEGKKLGLKVEKVFFDPEYKLEARMVGEKGLFFFGDWSEASEDEVKAASLSQLGRYAVSHRLVMKLNLWLGTALLILSYYLKQYLGSFINYLGLLILLFAVYLIVIGNLEGYFAHTYAAKHMDRKQYYQSLNSLKQKSGKDPKKAFGGFRTKSKKIITSIGPWLAKRG